MKSNGKEALVDRETREIPTFGFLPQMRTKKEKDKKMDMLIQMYWLIKGGGRKVSASGTVKFTDPIPPPPSPREVTIFIEISVFTAFIHNLPFCGHVHNLCHRL